MTLLLALFLTLAPERPAAPPVLETGTYASNVRMASNGDLVLAVWEDRRSGGSDILAARIDRDGQVLDAQGIVVAGTADVAEERPAVIWDGAQFVVLWFDPFGLHGTTVDLDGHVTATGTIDRNATALLGAARGHGGVLLSIRGTNGGDSAGFLRPGFVYEKTVELAFVRSGATQLVAWDEGFLLFWPEWPGLRFQRLDRDGHPYGLRLEVSLGPNTIWSIATATAPNGDALVAVAGGDNISVTRIRPGVLPAMTTNWLRWTAHRADAIVPRAGGFDVVAAEYNQPIVYRFDANDALAEVDKPVAAFTFSGGGAETAGRTFAAWEGFGRLTGTFAFDDAPAAAVARHAPPQRLPVLARDGQRALLAWNEDDRVMAEWIALDGSPLMEPVAISIRRANDPLAAACDTISCTLAWTHEESVAVARLRDDLAPNVLPVLPGTNPALASSGADTLLAWLDPAKQAKAALLSTQQAVDLPGSVTMPAAAFGRDSFLVVSTSANRFLRGTLVGRDGTVLAVHDYTSSPVEPPLAVAWDGHRYLIVYVRNQGLQGLFVDSEGVPEETEFPIVTFVAVRQRPPGVIWNGSAFVIAYGPVVIRLGSQGALIAETVDSPALLPANGGRSLVAYQRPVPELTNVPRVFTRVAGPENVHGISVTPAPIVVEAGETKTVTVSTQWSFALGVGFTTRNPAVATVSGTLGAGTRTTTLTITGVAVGDTELWDSVPNFGRAPGSDQLTVIQVRPPRRRATRH